MNNDQLKFQINKLTKVIENHQFPNSLECKRLERQLLQTKKVLKYGNRGDAKIDVDYFIKRKNEVKN